MCNSNITKSSPIAETFSNIISRKVNFHSHNTQESVQFAKYRIKVPLVILGSFIFCSIVTSFLPALQQAVANILYYFVGLISKEICLFTIWENIYLWEILRSPSPYQFHYRTTLLRNDISFENDIIISWKFIFIVSINKKKKNTV